MSRAIGRRRATALSALLALSLAGCGLPGEDRNRAVDTPVPYELLEPATPGTADSGTDDPIPLRVPVVAWVRGDDTLVPAPTGATCEDLPSEVVETALRTLTDSPTTDQRSAGWSSALPPSARLELVAVSGGLARVDVDLVDLGDPERLPLAVGQLVLSVTSAPEVDALEMVTSGRPVEAPLPGGALAEGPVTADDYARLLPREVQDTAGTGMASDLGCTGSGR